MKIKIGILFVFFSLTACFDSQFEINQNLHIKESEDKLNNVMVNYSQNSQLINSVEEILEHHQTVLDDFDKIEKNFSKDKDEKKLETIISLYGFAFTSFIHKQVQLIKSALPLRNKDISTLEK